MSKYYYHGIRGGIDINSYTINRMFRILESGGLKSNKLLHNSKFGGYNGIDYISVCSKQDINMYSNYKTNAFFNYIYNNYCFIISDKVDAIKTNYIDSEAYDYHYILELMEHNPNIRYSDMFDEYQVKDEIPSNYIIGVGFPFNINNVHLSGNVYKTFSKLHNLLDNLGLDIVDTSSIFFIKENENNKNNNDNKCKILTINNSN